LDDEKLQQVAARMRKVGERHQLLHINERLRIAVRQLENRILPEA